MYTGDMKLCIALLSVASLGLIPQASAYEVDGELVGNNPIEKIISASKSHAEADLKGPGKALKLNYTSVKPLTILVIYPKLDGGFAPLETLKVDLDKGINRDITIDLTASPGWSPWRKHYKLHFLAEAEDGASFQNIDFVPTGFSESIILSFKQALAKTPYTPSSYHRIPSFKLGGVSLTVIAGLAMIVVAVYLFVRKRYMQIVYVMIVGVLIMNVRFSLDAIEYALTHRVSNYATAGSLIEIARTISESDATGVRLCHDGTSYAERLLAYHIYPIRIQEDASHVVVHRSLDASYDGKQLRCGGSWYQAKEIQTFTDGSTLYEIAS